MIGKPNLIAHRIESIGGIDVYDIRDEEDYWIAQCRVNHHTGSAYFLLRPGDPAKAYFSDLRGAKAAETWLRDHRCNCDANLT